MRLRALSILVLVFVLPFLAVSARADTVLGPDLSTFAVLGGTPVVSFAARRVSTSLRPVFMEFSEYFHLS